MLLRNGSLIELVELKHPNQNHPFMHVSPQAHWNFKSQKEKHNTALASRNDAVQTIRLGSNRIHLFVKVSKTQQLESAAADFSGRKFR